MQLQLHFLLHFFFFFFHFECHLVDIRLKKGSVLMTTLTTVLGLVPLALGLGEGGESQAPLARAVIGGLTSSTLITLFFIPALYAGWEGWRERAREKKALRKQRKAEAAAAAAAQPA